VDELFLYLLLLSVAVLGVVGLVSPRTVMRWKPPGDSWFITGSAWCKTEARTRVISGFLLAVGLFGLAGKSLWGTLAMICYRSARGSWMIGPRSVQRSRARVT